MAINEKLHVLREYAKARDEGDTARASDIRNANSKWLTREDFETATR